MLILIEFMIVLVLGLTIGLLYKTWSCLDVMEMHYKLKTLNHFKVDLNDILKDITSKTSEKKDDVQA